MNKRKADIDSQLNNLKAEIKYTLQLLTNIDQMNTEKKLNSDYSLTKDYLEILKVQYESIETILTVNTKLEELLMKNKYKYSRNEENDVQCVSKPIMTKYNNLFLIQSSVMKHLENLDNYYDDREIDEDDPINIITDNFEKVVDLNDSKILDQQLLTQSSADTEEDSNAVQINEVSRKQTKKSCAVFSDISFSHVTKEKKEPIPKLPVLSENNQPLALEKQKIEFSGSKNQDSENINRTETIPFTNEINENSDITDRNDILYQIALWKEKKQKKTKGPVVPMPDITFGPPRCIFSDKSVKKELKAKTVQEVVAEPAVVEECVQEKTVLEKSKVRKRDQISIPPAPHLKIDDKFFINHLLSPSKFYVQLINEDNAKIDSLSQKLNQFYKDLEEKYSTKQEAFQAIGTFCAMYTGGNWYRGEVLDWILNMSRIEEQDQVQVQLIDHGNDIFISYKHLRRLRSRFCKLPRCAQRCHLSYLYPVNSTETNRLIPWPIEALVGFKNIIGDLNENVFKVLHAYYSKIRKSTELEFIHDNDCGEDKYIGQMLIDRGLAVEIVDENNFVINNNLMMNQIKRVNALTDSGLEQDTPLEKKLDEFFENSEQEEAATLSEAIIHYNPRDEAETCRVMRPNGTCYKGSSCKFRHTPLKDYTMDKLPVYKTTLNTYPPLNAGDELTVVISHVDNIQKFYVQVVRDDPSGKSLSSLVQKMNSPEIVKMYKQLKNPPALSEIVIVKHWNNLWYRGMVTDVVLYEHPKIIQVTVFVVDFGDILVVQMKDLREIMELLLELPFQAYLSRFFNVRSNKNITEEEQTLYLEERYLGHKLTAKAISANNGLLYLQLFENGHDVGLKLISEGCGEYDDEPHFTRNELLLID